MVPPDDVPPDDTCPTGPFSSQLLTGPPARDPLTVVGRLLAVQAQDLRGARLAIRPRSRGLQAAAVDRALTADRSLLVTWVNRGTLHLIRREDYPWLLALTAPSQLAGNARRLGQEGVSADAAERGAAIVEAELVAHGPRTREQLKERLTAAGIRTEGQALVHILALASFRGRVVRAPIVGGEQAFVAVNDWLGEMPVADPATAIVELGRRFLAGHAPATERDLARWAGITLGQARAGFRAIGAELEEVPGGAVLTKDLARWRREGSDRPPPRLLGAFDPLLHGWVSRRPILADQQSVVTVNGIFRPFALVDGRAVGVWGLAGGVVSLRPFGPLPDATVAALAVDATDVLRYLGLPNRADPLVLDAGPGA
jgi:DNA glycosylase AlkZ-like